MYICLAHVLLCYLADPAFGENYPAEALTCTARQQVGALVVCLVASL